MKNLSRPCVSSLRPANMVIPRLNLDHGGSAPRRVKAGCLKLLAFIKRYKTVADDEAMMQELFQQVEMQSRLEGTQWHEVNKCHEPVTDKHRRFNMYRYLAAAAGVVRPVLPRTHPHSDVGSAPGLEEHYPVVTHLPSSLSQPHATSPNPWLQSSHARSERPPRL